MFSPAATTRSSSASLARESDTTKIIIDSKTTNTMEKEKNAKLQYTPPMVASIAISHEQGIASGSSNTSLSDMDTTVIFDDSFI